MSSRFSSNSDVNIKNREEMFPRLYTLNDKLSLFKSSNKRVKIRHLRFEQKTKIRTCLHEEVVVYIYNLYLLK